MEQWQQEDAEARQQMEEMMRQFALEDAEARMVLNRHPPPAELAPAPAPARAPAAAAPAPTPPPLAPAAQAPARNPARRPTGIPGRQPDRQPGHLRERVHGPGRLDLQDLPDIDNPRAPPLPTPARARARARTPAAAASPPSPAARANTPPRNPRGPIAIPGRQADRQPDHLRERVHGPGGLGFRDLPDLDYPHTRVRAPATGRGHAPAGSAAGRVRPRDPAHPRGTGSQPEAAGRQQQPHPDADVSAYLNDPDVRIVSDDDPYRAPRGPPPRMGMPPPPYGYGMVAGPAAAPPPPPMVGVGMAAGAGYPGVMTVTQTGSGSVRYQYNWGIGGGQGAGGAQTGMGAPVAMVYPPAVDMRRQMYYQVIGHGHLHYETRW
ncbi:hypothetical protein GE09DRAFT_187599 [Coniochaeta sp. 2T2.1]|nr:hypothetical protein GE09DRAFT_187599 [Coniochaeta sp. 2T2.1]